MVHALGIANSCTWTQSYSSPRRKSDPCNFSAGELNWKPGTYWSDFIAEASEQFCSSGITAYLWPVRSFLLLQQEWLLLRLLVANVVIIFVYKAGQFLSRSFIVTRDLCEQAALHEDSWNPSKYVSGCCNRNWRSERPEHDHVGCRSRQQSLPPRLILVEGSAFTYWMLHLVMLQMLKACLLR